MTQTHASFKNCLRVVHNPTESRGLDKLDEYMNMVNTWEIQKVNVQKMVQNQNCFKENIALRHLKKLKGKCSKDGMVQNPNFLT